MRTAAIAFIQVHRATKKPQNPVICRLAYPAPHPEVSSDSELLVLVDPLDQELGALSKDACHDGDGVLHRAFSVFLFNEREELLIQQRSQTKRLWPGYWANSCCSHPLAGEKMSDAVQRRVEQELGLQVAPEFIFKFEYQAGFGDAGSEHELCHVFVAHSVQQPKVNANEVQAWRWIGIDQLSTELEEHPHVFTPWLKLEWPKLLECDQV